jgi:PAS domain S-box-containing protein
MSTGKQSFNLKVRFGLLTVVFTLVLLNTVTLAIVYQTRKAKRQEVAAGLHSASVAVSREVQKRFPGSLTTEQAARLCRDFNLRALHLLPPRPVRENEKLRQEWLVAAARRVPLGDIGPLAEAVLTTDFYIPQRFQDTEYYYLYPVPRGSSYEILILRKNVPGLAYLDGAGERILYLGLFALALCTGVAAYLYRIVIAPFESIRRQARQAGRQIEPDGAGTDVEAVVEEYRRLVDDLRARESELRQLNAQIQKHADSVEEFNQYLLRSMTSGLLTVDLEGRIASVNNAATRMLGLEDEIPLVRKKARAVMQHVPQLVELVETALRSESPTGYREMTLGDQHDNAFVLGVTLSDVRDPDGHRLGVAVLLNDLSELAQLRRALETREKMAALGEMAGGLAHQLRNAMGVISGYGRLARKKLLKSGEQVESVDSLLAEVAQSETMIGRFLTYARPIDLARETVLLREFLSEIVDTAAVKPACRSVRIDLTIPEDITVDLDPVLFKQVVVNLIENAVRACQGTKGVVTIKAAATTRGLEIQVSDTGCGMEPELLETVFTPFVSSRPDGTGLGLPVAQKIIDLHDGSLQVHSEPNAGTEFTIILPESSVKSGTKLPSPPVTAV